MSCFLPSVSFFLSVSNLLFSLSFFVYLHLRTVFVNFLLPFTCVALKFLCCALRACYVGQYVSRDVVFYLPDVFISRAGFVLPRHSEQTSFPCLFCLCLGEERSLRSASSLPHTLPLRFPMPAVRTM